jgi:hypothetical protein
LRKTKDFFTYFYFRTRGVTLVADRITSFAIAQSLIDHGGNGLLGRKELAIDEKIKVATMTNSVQ